MTCDLTLCQDAVPTTPYLYNTQYKPLSIWKRHLIVYPYMICGGLFASAALMSGWYASYRACMKMPESECVFVAIWVNNSVWKWGFTEALARAPTHHDFRSPSPRVSYRMSLWKPVCRWTIIISESLEELQEKMIPWKSSMEEDGIGDSICFKNVAKRFSGELWTASLANYDNQPTPSTPITGDIKECLYLSQHLAYSWLIKLCVFSSKFFYVNIFQVILVRTDSNLCRKVLTVHQRAPSRYGSHYLMIPDRGFPKWGRFSFQIFP